MVKFKDEILAEIEQIKSPKDLWDIQQASRARRLTVATDLFKKLKVGNVVMVQNFGAENGWSKVKVTKVKRSWFLGDDVVTGQSWNMKSTTIIEILEA